MNRLMFFRKIKNITQAKMAKELNVTRVCVSQWESKVRFPNITMIPKMAKILNCSIEDIVLCFCEDESKEVV